MIAMSDRTMIAGANVGRVREQRDSEPDQPVRPELEHDAGEDHRARGRRLGVGVGEPGVEREHRDLDREGEEEREERGQLEGRREAARRVRREGAELREVEGADPRTGVRGLVGEAGRQDRHEHEQRADEGVQDELDRRVDAVAAAPDPDDQVHRDEHDLPEDVEQEQVQREEHADQADLEDEERDHVFLDPRLDRLEAREDADPGQGRRQDDERGGQAIDAELVLDAEQRDPVGGLDVLEARARRQVADQQEQREHPGHERRPERRRPGIRARQDGDEDRADERQERDDRQDRHGVHGHCPFPASSR
jgi:hypothetical protein